MPSNLNQKIPSRYPRDSRFFRHKKKRYRLPWPQTVGCPEQRNHRSRGGFPTSPGALPSEQGQWIHRLQFGHAAVSDWNVVRVEARQYWSRGHWMGPFLGVIKRCKCTVILWEFPFTLENPGSPDDLMVSWNLYKCVSFRWLDIPIIWEYDCVLIVPCLGW